MGANIIKVKPPSDVIDLDAAKSVYENRRHRPLDARGAHPARHACAFAGKRSSVLGRRGDDTAGFLEEIRQIRAGGGSGSIIGRNSFRGPRRKPWHARRGDQDLPERGVSGVLEETERRAASPT